MIQTTATQRNGAPSVNKDAIRPFRVNIPEKSLIDLRRRIAATRWPDKETVDDRSQGAQLAKLQESRSVLGQRLRLAQGRGEAERLFPDEVFRAQENWARRAFRNLIYFHEADRGGHFAMWEHPQLFSEEIRAAFRSLR